MMSWIWNFPSWAKPSWKGPKPNQAKLGYFNFQAETELTILMYVNKQQILVSNQNCNQISHSL